MPAPTSFEERLNARIAASQGRQRQAREDLSDSFQAADQSQSAQVNAGRDAASIASRPIGITGASRRPSPVQAQVSMGNADVLQRLDAVMWQSFGLGSVFPAAPLGRYPVVYCETLEEFFAPMLADEDISDSTRQDVLAASVADAEAYADAHRGGVFGVNLPGRGCYVNGWLFGFIHDMSPRAALQDAGVFPTIMETVCHEKLGHGFIAELTAVGREKTQLGLWRFDWARSFGLRTVDTPRSALLVQKHALVHESSKFTEEGWATWIEQLMGWLAAQYGLINRNRMPERLGAKYRLEDVATLLDALAAHAPIETPRGVVEQLSEATHLLLVDADPKTVGALLPAMQVWQQQAQRFDEAFLEMFGQPALYVLGYLLFRRLEARLGWQNLPYAVAIAGNVTYDLEAISVSDLAGLLFGDPRLNVDARLALLGSLRLEPHHGPNVLAQQARAVLNLAVPEF
jgi:hypothetical protein